MNVDVACVQICDTTDHQWTYKYLSEYVDSWTTTSNSPAFVMLPTPDAESHKADEAADGEGSKKWKLSQPRRKNPPKTTGRKNMENKYLKIVIRRRVSMQRFQLYHILSNDKQHAYIQKNVPNNYSFFGIVVSRGNSRRNWNVCFDVILCDKKVMVNISRGKLEVVQPHDGPSSQI
jgi:hypothetical protein